MKKFALSLIGAGISTIALVNSALAVPITFTGIVPSACSIKDIQASVLGANSANPNQLSSQYSGGIPAAITVICNTGTSRVTITPNVAASTLPAGGFIEYQLLNNSGNTGIYAGLNTPSFQQPQVPSYTTPIASDTTSPTGDSLHIHTKIVAPTGIVLAAGNYQTLLDITLTP